MGQLSHSMSRPKLPGFYFDESRERYFKIVNGDQRHNLAYTNNTIKAKERHIELEIEENKRQRDELGKPYSASISAERQLVAAKFSDCALRKRLGASPDCFGLMSKINSTTSITKVFDFPSWPIMDDAHIMVAKGSCLELHAISQFFFNEFPNPLVTYCFPQSNFGSEVDRENLNVKQVEGVDILGEWMKCWYGDIFTLLRWHVDRRTGNYVVSNFDIPTLLRSYWHSMFPSDMDVWNYVRRGYIFTCFDVECLHIFFKQSVNVVVSLDPFLVLRASLFNMEEALIPTTDSTLLIQNAVLVYNIGKYLITSFDDSTNIEWSFNSPLLAFYTTEFDTDLQVSRSGGRTRFILITTTAIIIRDANSSTFEFWEELNIPIRNDNQARPVIYKSGEYILVEEGRGTFKIVDAKRLVASTVKFNFNLPSPRGSMPRMYEIGGRLLLSTASETYHLSSIQLATNKYKP